MTRFSIPARSAARAMIAARIVGCRRPPRRPRKTGASGVRLLVRAQSGELLRERRCERLAPRLAALARADEDGGVGAIEVDVAPVEGDQLRAAKAGQHERHEHQPVALGEPPVAPRGPGRGLEQPLKLRRRKPVRHLPRLRGRFEIAERVRQTGATRVPAKEPAQEDEAPVVGGRGRVRPVAILVEVDDDHSFLDRALARAAALDPAQEVIENDAIRGHGALAAARARETTKPVVARRMKRTRRGSADVGAGGDADVAQALRDDREGGAPVTGPSRGAQGLPEPADRQAVG